MFADNGWSIINESAVYQAVNSLPRYANFG